MKIHFDQQTGNLTIDGKKYNGFIAEDDGCNTCKGPVVLSHDFDALFCPNCNEWLESSCKDSDCEFCAHRPIKPI